jgi:hypothetical protein
MDEPECAPVKGIRMRATSMRRLVGGAAALMLVGTMLLTATGSVLASVPAATSTTDALPATVTGDIVGFRTNLFYADGSTLAKAFVTIFTDGTGTNRYVQATRNGAPVAKACTVVSDLVSCTFKTVRTNDHLAVTVAYDRIATIATARGIWSSTGSPTSDTGDNSHGDTWTDPDGAATATYDATSTDYAGGFSIVAGSSIGNAQAVSSTNRQATRVAGLQAGIAATVLDGASVQGDCGPYDCGTAIGEWSVVSVGDGQTFGTPFQIVITFYAGTPRSFVHQYVDDAGVTQYELIGACPKKNPASGAPCFTWSAKDNEATIYTYHNGGLKGLS